MLRIARPYVLSVLSVMGHPQSPLLLSVSYPQVTHPNFEKFQN